MQIDRVITACGNGPVCPAAYPTDTSRWLVQGKLLSPTMRAAMAIPADEDAVAIPATIIELIRRQPFMDEEALGNWIVENHETDVFRLEGLDRYLTDSDEADFQAWLAGNGGRDLESKAPWLKFLGEATTAPKSWRRVRIMRSHSDYNLFEAECCYLDNAGAGEQIRIIDLTERTLDPELGDLDDFYVVNNQAVVMAYDDDGRYLYALPLERPERLVEAKERLWEAAEPLETWWARHHQDRRAA